MSANQDEEFWETILNNDEIKYLQKKLPKGFCLIAPTKNVKNNKSSRGLPSLNMGQSTTEKVTGSSTGHGQKREHRSSRVRNLGEDLGHQKFHYHEMPYTNTK